MASWLHGNEEGEGKCLPSAFIGLMTENGGGGGAYEETPLI